MTNLFLILTTYKTGLDKHNSDRYNILTDLEECITDISDAQTELMGDTDDVQDELDKYISDNKSNQNLLPNEIWLKLLGPYYDSVILKQIIYVSHL